MLERQQVGAQIDDECRSLLRGGDWQDEQLQHSSIPILILGTIDGQERGRLSATLILQRELDEASGLYVEKTRDINLGNIRVDSDCRRSGVGSAMLTELNRQAKLFGVKTVFGKVIDSDVAETQGLLEFYRKNGFSIGRRGEGWEIVKVFSHKGLH